MLTDEDVKKLMTVLATKDDVVELKQDLEILKESVNALTNSIDAILKQLTDLHTEFIAITNKVNRLEQWIKTVAEKTGVKLPL